MNEIFVYHLVLDKEIGTVLPYIDSVLQTGQNKTIPTSWLKMDLRDLTISEKFEIIGEGRIENLKYFDYPLKTSDIIGERLFITK